MLILLLACSVDAPEASSERPISWDRSSHRSRFCDDEARVLCYAERQSNGIALSCLSGEPYDRVCRAGDVVGVKP